MSFSLQKVKQDEYLKYRDIIRESLLSHILNTYGEWKESECKKGFYENDNFFIKINGEIAGNLALEEKKEALYVINIILLPKFTGRGFGPKVFKKIIFPKAKELKKAVELEVHRSNERAKNFYTNKLNFEQFGENKTHFLMRKDL